MGGLITNEPVVRVDLFLTDPADELVAQVMF